MIFLLHLSAVLCCEACEATYLQFELEHAEIVVLEAKAAYAATEGILADHCIPSSRSADLLEKLPSVEAIDVEPTHVDAKINGMEENLQGSLLPVITSPMDVDMSIAVASAAEEKRGNKGISTRSKRREETQKQQD
ncbi:hypothetical protein CBR_g12800 [Chara braunii]|uniref:Protease Do-like PDZ domain-containing protein n=1 Tax=Chara braunii TaxID=69332 RepID=A0A388KSP7_CHABU|nr:hypothetical protein CBR_g12800 [Chara braunii]|eukprot:GBG73084.1 hypothetical protein CBR_g12800 [Chara braunii]